MLVLLPVRSVQAAPDDTWWPNSIGTVVHVSNADDLKDYLSRVGDYTVVLEKDIDKHDNADVHDWCTINGRKVLDLNGHSIKVGNDKKIISNLFYVPVGCIMIINDYKDAVKRDDVEIFYDTRVRDFDDAADYVRNAFLVHGTLIQNGGYIRAGRKSSWYNHNAITGDYGTQYKVVEGSGVVLDNDGRFVMNDGWVSGFRYDAVNQIENSSAVTYINHGNIEGLAYAKCYNGSRYIASGSFEAHSVSKVTKIRIEGYAESHNPYAVTCRAGNISSTQGFASDATYQYSQNGSGFDLEDSYMEVTPGIGKLAHLTLSSNDYHKTDEDDKYGFYIVDANTSDFSAQTSAEIYFKGIPADLDEICEHEISYHWQVFLGDQCLAELRTKENTIYFADFAGNGFYPEVGTVYKVKSEIVESLKDKVAFVRKCENAVRVAIDAPLEVVELSAENFPDIVFRNYLSQNFDEDKDGILVARELKKINVLHLGGTSESTVSSLQGIKLLPYVVEVYAYENPGLRKVDCSGLQALKLLDLERCNIDELNLTGCSDLEKLYLGGIHAYGRDGMLSQLDLTSCPNLRALEIYKSKLQNLDISKCPRLVEAVLYGTEKDMSDYGYIEQRYDETGAYVQTTYNSQQFFIVARIDEDLTNEYLQRALKSVYGINDDDVLTNVEVTLVTGLEIDYSGLTSAEWLKLFPNLDYLNLQLNDLTEIDLSWNKKLKIVYLDNNAFASLDVSMLSDLEELSVDRNKEALGTLDFSANKNLCTLDLNRSGVTSVNLRGLKQLGSLDLTGNNISKLDLNSNTALRELDISDNPLSGLEIAALSELEVLNAENLALEEIDLTGCQKLKRVVLTGNYLTELDITQNEILKSLFNSGTYTEGTNSSTGRKWVRYSKTDSNSRMTLDEGVAIFDGTEPITLVSQPEDYEGNFGDMATFTIVARGDYLNYQWQQLRDGEWVDLEGDTVNLPTLKIKMMASNFAYPLRCVVSKNMIEITSNNCWMRPLSNSVVATGLEFPIPGRTASASLQGLVSAAPGSYTIDTAKSAWYGKNKVKLQPEDRFMFGEAYYLKLHLVPTDSSNPQLPNASSVYPLEVSCNIPNNMMGLYGAGTVTDILCKGCVSYMNTDGSMDLYFGLNPANAGDVQKDAAVSLKVSGGTITTYPLKALNMRSYNYNETVNGEAKEYQAPTQLWFEDAGLFWSNAAYVSIDGKDCQDNTKVWKTVCGLQDVGLVGLYPNTKYQLQFGLLEDAGLGVQEISATTPEVPSDKLAAGSYVQASLPELDNYVKLLTNVDITANLTTDHGEMLSFTVSGAGLTKPNGGALQNQRLVVILQKENADGSRVTLPTIVLQANANNVYRYVVDETMDWNRVYAYLMAKDEVKTASDVCYLSQVKELRPFSVCYDPNGGSGNPVYAHATEQNNTVTLPAANLFMAASNFKFESWEVDGTTKQPGEEITVTKDLVIKAKWIDSSAPELMDAVAGNNGVTFTWQANMGVSTYAIFRKVENGKYEKLAITTGTGDEKVSANAGEICTYVDTMAQNGVTYTYTARGINVNDDKYITGYDANGKTVLMEVPEEELDKSSPVLLEAVANSTGITITWKANSGVFKYAVFRKTEGGKWEKLQITTGSGNESVKAMTGSTCSYVDTTAEAGVTYVYTVRGVDETGNYVTSFDQNGISATMTGSGVSPLPTLGKALPGNNGITVTWTASGGVLKYQVFRKVAGGKWEKLQVTTGSGNESTMAQAGATCSYLDKTAQAGTTYYYTVRGVDASGKYVTSYDKKGVSAKMTSQQEQLDKSSPVLLGATATASGIQVTWTANSGVPKYAIFRKTEGSKWVKLGVTTGSGDESVKATAGSTCSVVDPTAEAGVTYIYTVRGVNASGKYITEFAATGVSATMTNQEEQLDASSPALQGATATANGIQVTWKANSGVLKYQVFRKVAGGKWIKLGITTGSGNESVKATAGSICSFVDGAAEAGVNYVYTVRGVDASGNYVTSYNSKGVSCKK
jgi:hypothetical protein